MAETIMCWCTLFQIPTTRAKSPKFSRRNSSVSEGMHGSFESSNRRRTSTGVSPEGQNGGFSNSSRSFSIGVLNERSHLMPNDVKSGKAKNILAHPKQRIKRSLSRSQSEKLKVNGTENSLKYNDVAGTMKACQETPTKNGSKDYDAEDADDAATEVGQVISVSMSESENVKVEDLEEAIDSHDGEDVNNPSNGIVYDLGSNAISEVHATMVHESSTQKDVARKGVKKILNSVEKKWDSSSSKNGWPHQNRSKEEITGTKERVIRREKLKASTPLFRVKKKDEPH